MGVDAIRGSQLTLSEYDAIVNGWKRAGDEDEVEAPSVDQWEREQERILANPALTGG